MSIKPLDNLVQKKYKLIMASFCMQKKPVKRDLGNYTGHEHEKKMFKIFLLKRILK